MGTTHSGTSASIFISATSPGMTTTATPRLAIATRIARLKICGSWPGIGDKLDVMAAILEQALGMGRLEVVDADFAAGDVRGYGKDRHAAALTIEKAVDQMQVAGTAAAGADREISSHMRFGACCEGGSLLVPHMDPINRLSPSQGIGKAVEEVCRQPRRPASRRSFQALRQETLLLSYSLRKPSICRRAPTRSPKAKRHSSSG